jgi:hypothetical protein
MLDAALETCDTEFGEFRNEGTDFDKPQSLELREFLETVYMKGPVRWFILMSDLLDYCLCHRKVRLEWLQLCHKSGRNRL